MPYQPGGHAGNKMKIVDLLHVFNSYDACISFMYQLLRIRPLSAVICRELTIEHFQLKMITG